MEISIKQELSKTYLIAEEKGFFKADFRFKMLLSNNVKGLLSCSEHNIDDRVRLYFDITGKSSLKDYCEEFGIKSELIRQIVTGLLVLEEECSEYMMNMDNISLVSDHIFVENNRVFFCYFPWESKEIKGSFHELIIELMDYGDRKDRECMKLLYELHGLTRQNYDLDEVIKTIGSVDEQIIEKRSVEKEIDDEISEEEYFYRKPESYNKEEYNMEPVKDEYMSENMSRYDKKQLRAERKEERRKYIEQLRRERRLRRIRDDEPDRELYDDEYDERFEPDFENSRHFINYENSRKVTKYENGQRHCNFR